MPNQLHLHCASHTVIEEDGERGTNEIAVTRDWSARKGIWWMGVGMSVYVTLRDVVTLRDLCNLKGLEI